MVRASCHPAHRADHLHQRRPAAGPPLTGGRGRSELHLLRHRLGVLVAQVAVGAHGQGATVFVAPSTPHRRLFDDLGNSRLQSYAKRHFLGHGGGVLVTEMTVNLHSQRTTVLVAQPARDGGDVHTGFDAARSEEMTKIVVGDSFHADESCRSVHGFLALVDIHDVSGCVFGRTLRL